MEIIKYEGNSNYIIVLYKQDDKLYVLYARTGNMSLNNEVEDYDILDHYEDIRTRFIIQHNFTINIPLLQRGNKVFSIIQVDNEKAYDLIKTVVEDLL
jgi:hypothetical protein